MKKFFFLLLILFLHLTMSEMNAQIGWYQQVSGTEHALYGIHFSDPNTGTAVGTFGTILRTTDGGKTWAAQNSGTNSHFFDVHFINANVGTVVGIPGTILRTTDAGQTWASQTSGVITALQSVYFTDVNNGIAVGHTGTILRTSDGGTNWVKLPDAPTSLRAVHFTDVSNGISVGDNGLVMRTTDGGVNWIQQPSSIQVNLQGVWLTDINTGTVVGGSNLTGARIYRTTDSGTSWALQHSIPNVALTDVYFTDSQTGTAVGWNGIILRTTNGGETWESQNSNTINSLVSVFFVNTDIGFAVGSVGTILATTDGGIPVELSSFTASVNGNDVTLNWRTASEINNMGFEVERKILFPIIRDQNDNILWEKAGFVEGNGTTTGTSNYGFVDEGLATGIYNYRLKQIDFDGAFEYSKIIEVEIGIPAQFALFQNYPNPFNPVTKIKYNIPGVIAGETRQSQIITLKVYDILGNEVAVLINEEKSSGTYEVDFNASGLSSGVYYYQLKANDYIETKRMILLR